MSYAEFRSHLRGQGSGFLPQVRLEVESWFLRRLRSLDRGRNNLPPSPTPPPRTFAIVTPPLPARTCGKGNRGGAKILVEGWEGRDEESTR